MMLKQRNKNFAFTLIELLIVIAVIGLLSIMSVAYLQSAKAKARDVDRLGYIKQLQQSLDFYYDKNGNFPISSNCGATTPSTDWCNSIESLSGNRWIRDDGSANLSEFLTNDPIDPSDSGVATYPPLDGGTYFYLSNDAIGSSGKWYIIVFGLEDHEHPYQTQDGLVAPDGTNYHIGNNVNGIITVGENYN